MISCCGIVTIHTRLARVLFGKVVAGQYLHGIIDNGDFDHEEAADGEYSLDVVVLYKEVQSLKYAGTPFLLFVVSHCLPTCKVPAS